MTLKFVWSLAACLLITADTFAGQGSPQDVQAALRRDVDAMSVRLGGRGTPQQAVADAERLAAGYRALGPGPRGFGPADYALNREVARRSLDWLARASVLYGRDPYVAQAFLSSYDSIGRFYGDFGPFYYPGAFVAYAAATRLAQRLALEGRDAARYERDLERYALAYGTIAVARGALLTPWNFARDLPDTATVSLEPAVVLKPVELPAVDVAGFDADQRAAWSAARDRFRSVAPRVHQARVLLNELSARLQRQRMALNPEDAANALKMQGYLDDAVELMTEKRFDLAEQALTRAEYVRNKLRGATGQ